MALRYECQNAEFSGCFVKYSEAWTRGEVRIMLLADDTEQIMATLASKIVDLHLNCINAPPITEPEQLTTDAIDAVDMRLWKWFGGTWTVALEEITQLGNALRRTLLNGAGEEPTEPASVRLNNS